MSKVSTTVSRAILINVLTKDYDGDTTNVVFVNRSNKYTYFIKNIHVYCNCNDDAVTKAFALVIGGLTMVFARSTIELEDSGDPNQNFITYCDRATSSVDNIASVAKLVLVSLPKEALEPYESITCHIVNGAVDDVYNIAMQFIRVPARVALTV